jgi:regulatory associated protein of mTOR
VIESCLDPTVEDVRHACHTLRRHARRDRALIHYNGHGVPKPTPNGELWVFNKTFTQYIPLSTADLCAWLGSPGVLVLDCSAAGNIIDFYERQVEAASSAAAEAASAEVETEVEEGVMGSESRSPGSKKAEAQPPQSEAEERQRSENSAVAGNPGNAGVAVGFDRRIQKYTSTDSDRPISRQNSRDFRQGDRTASRMSSTDGFSGGSAERDNSLQTWVMVGACRAGEILPQNPELPADIFTSCLTTPLKMALRWYMMHESVMGLTVDMLDHIPGALNDRKSPLGELYWIFTAVTDTIAWNVLPRGLFHQLFRQDLLLASSETSSW